MESLEALKRLEWLRCGTIGRQTPQTHPSFRGSFAQSNPESSFSDA